MKDETLDDMLFNIQSLNYITKRLYIKSYQSFSYMKSDDIVELYNLALEHKIANDKKINEMYKKFRGKK